MPGRRPPIGGREKSRAISAMWASLCLYHGDLGCIHGDNVRAALRPGVGDPFQGDGSRIWLNEGGADRPRPERRSISHKSHPAYKRGRSGCTLPRRREFGNCERRLMSRAYKTRARRNCLPATLRPAGVSRQPFAFRRSGSRARTREGMRYRADIGSDERLFFVAAGVEGTVGWYGLPSRRSFRSTRSPTIGGPDGAQRRPTPDQRGVRWSARHGGYHPALTGCGSRGSARTVLARRCDCWVLCAAG